MLLLTPRWPWPANGGDRLRLLKLAEAMCARYDITLLSTCQTAGEMSAPVPTNAPFAAVHRVHLPRWRSWWQMMCSLFTPGLPLQVAYYRSDTLAAAVQHLIPSHDLLACHLARLAPYVTGTSVPCWVELTDAVSLTMQRAATLLRPRAAPRAWLFQLEATRMQAWERALSGRVDLLSLVSPVDREHLFAGRAPERARIVVAPNGVTLPASAGRPAGERPPSVVLLGRMDALANRDALWFFVREVWPSVRKTLPDATLHVVGHVILRDRWRLRRVPGIRLHGVVDQLSDVLLHARVGVCPVRFGAGVQNKLLDYLAHGCAAVTSPVGLEGLDAQAGRDLRLASKRDQWVNEVVELLRDHAAASALGLAGRTVAERYGWQQALKPLMVEIEGLMNRQPT